MIARWISLLLLFSTAPASGHAQKRCYNALEFGAAGDGKTINTRSIQQAIDKATSSGGGSVCVPAGTFVTGALRLHSNVDLHLESGAILKGSGRLEDYYLDGKLVGLLFTQDAVNVSITGQRTIDDNGDSFMGLHWGEVRQPFFTHGVEISQFEGVTIDGGRYAAAPHGSRAYPIALRDGKKAHLLVGDTPVFRERVQPAF